MPKEETAVTSPRSAREPTPDIAPEDDWRRIPDRKAKKRVQNRVAQRSYRQRMKARLEELQAKVSMHEQRVETGQPMGEHQTSPLRDGSPGARYSSMTHDFLSADGSPSHGGQKRKRALSDSEYDMVCGFANEYPAHTLPPAMRLSSIPNDGDMSFAMLPTHDPANFLGRPRAYTTETPKFYGSSSDLNSDLGMQMPPTATPSLHSSSRTSMQSESSMGSTFQPYLSDIPQNQHDWNTTDRLSRPTPPPMNAQLHGQPLPPSCFADFSLAPDAGSDFVHDFTFQDPNDMTMPINLQDMRDPWKALPTSMPTTLAHAQTAIVTPPLMGFQASPQSLPLTRDNTTSRSPIREFARPPKPELAAPLEPLTAPGRDAPMEQRLKYVTDQARAMGFANFDDAIIAFYSHTFRESSPLFNDQRLSRNRRLPRVLAALRDAAQDWSEWERRGFQEEIIRAAEENLVKEFHAFRSGATFADCMTVFDRAGEVRNMSRTAMNNHPVRRKVQDEVSILERVYLWMTSNSLAAT
ncbi:hypothetical protein ANO11243_045330 [Dothideomycetidae sp. 11243]|nr:hypothetical protein ANO11243_045330 [fungal sp. No.11243]